MPAMAADGSGVESILSATAPGPAVGISPLSEPPRPSVNTFWNPPYSRPMSRTGLCQCSKPPQETPAPSQRSPQYGRGPSEIGRRSIYDQPFVGPRQSNHHEPLRQGRSRNEASSHRQGQARPTPVPDALGQGPHDPRLAGVSLGSNKC